MKNRFFDGNASVPLSIFFSLVIVAVAFVYRAGVKAQPSTVSRPDATKEIVDNSGGVVLPVKWGDMGMRLTKAGVIDRQKFLAIYADRGGLTDEEMKLLSGAENGNLRMTKENSGVILNLLWALGLGNKDSILDNGPMTDPRYGGGAPPAGGFASTGGWTLAVGGPMEHYSMHDFMNLTPEQQALVDEVTKNIYRPCCNNSTYFPDCNHGMAMLGLMELAASQGANEATLYNIALTANSFWFPDTYQNISKFLSQKGIDPASVPAKDVLSAQYSSGSGYQAVVAALKPTQNKGSSCGV